MNWTYFPVAIVCGNITRAEFDCNATVSFPQVILLRCFTHPSIDESFKVKQFSVFAKFSRLSLALKKQQIAVVALCVWY